MLAAYYSQKSFTKNINNQNILLHLDNVTAIAFINKMGGVRLQKLNKIAKDIWQYCRNKNIWIVASYINTKLNYEADKESRTLHIETEYTNYQILNLTIHYFLGRTILLCISSIFANPSGPKEN